MGTKKGKGKSARAERALSRLKHARETGLLVEVERRIPYADALDGFVVATGREWIALARVSDEIDLDGWVMLRLHDVRSVRLYPADCLAVKALTIRGQWPPVAPVVRLDHVTELITDAAARAPMVTVHREFHRPDACWIGVVRKVSGRTISLLKVDPSGRWARKPCTYRLNQVTRVDVGGRYEDALHLVAGPAPKRGR
jgi:hypothetical protein